MVITLKAGDYSESIHIKYTSVFGPSVREFQFWALFWILGDRRLDRSVVVKLSEILVEDFLVALWSQWRIA